MAEALNEIGIGHVGAAEGDEVGRTVLHCRLGRVEGVATGGDEWAVEDGAELTKSHRSAERVKAEGEAVDDMEIGEGVAIEKLGQ